jgi:methionyl-tRNA synthetase
MSKNFYLTTTLPYVNADPHIGFALESVQADAIVRYRRLMGDTVFFTTGTDEHGQKIYQKAKEEGRNVQEYVDHFAGQFRKLQRALDLSYDAFIRTTDERHIKAAQELWKRCEAAGDIYKKKYKGLYCVGDEAFLTESDIVDGKCPNHPNMELQEIEEENYFFRLSRYQESILQYLQKEGVIVPEWRRQEAVNFVQKGLEDFSISRETSRMDWGIPVPGDESQVMYVWFDALTNYISTLGWPDDSEGFYKNFWEKGFTLQIAGKDQVRFQSIMWQAMLMSASLPTTDRVLYHGFITSGGQKMSKSLGNVIEPYTLVDEYGTDAVRYFLLRHIHPFDDSDFTMERFKEAYNADLANGIGNLASRIMNLAEKNLDACPDSVDVSGGNSIPIPNEFTDAMDRYDFQTAAMEIMRSVRVVDEKITNTRPFSVIKADVEEGKNMIASLVSDLWDISLLMRPLMPKTADAIKDAILANKKPENLFQRKD